MPSGRLEVRHPGSGTARQDLREADLAEIPPARRPAMPDRLNLSRVTKPAKEAVWSVTGQAAADRDWLPARRP